MTTPTLLCVHAHPDDESLFTAGILAHYREQGIRTVLVTCTNGQFGIDHAGRGGDVPEHDAPSTLATRALELDAAAALLGVDRVVRLPFSDSGMRGWPQNELDTAFVNCDVAGTAQHLADLIDEEQATVVVTYDENGYYGHPDHVMANTVTRAAVQRSRAAERLFYPVTPRSVLSEFLLRAESQNLSLPAWITEAVPDIPDDTIDVIMDVSRFSALKQRAIATHASQIDNNDLVTMDPDLFALLFGTEYYQLGWRRRTESIACAHDLFGGMQ